MNWLDRMAVARLEKHPDVIVAIRLDTDSGVHYSFPLGTEADAKKVREFLKHHRPPPKEPERRLIKIEPRPIDGIMRTSYMFRAGGTIETWPAEEGEHEKSPWQKEVDERLGKVEHWQDMHSHIWALDRIEELEDKQSEVEAFFLERFGSYVELIRKEEETANRAEHHLSVCAELEERVDMLEVTAENIIWGNWDVERCAAHIIDLEEDVRVERAKTHHNTKKLAQLDGKWQQWRGGYESTRSKFLHRLKELEEQAHTHPSLCVVGQAVPSSEPEKKWPHGVCGRFNRLVACLGSDKCTAVRMFEGECRYWAGQTPDADPKWHGPDCSCPKCWPETAPDKIKRERAPGNEPDIERLAEVAFNGFHSFWEGVADYPVLNIPYKKSWEAVARAILKELGYEGEGAATGPTCPKCKSTNTEWLATEAGHMIKCEGCKCISNRWPPPEIEVEGHELKNGDTKGTFSYVMASRVTPAEERGSAFPGPFAFLYEFSLELMKRYEQHRPSKGDSWKEMDLSSLHCKLDEEYQEYVELMVGDDPKPELIDLALVAAMCWAREGQPPTDRTIKKDSNHQAEKGEE